MSAQHYDDLDPLYRATWGTSLHHGLWITGRESPTLAKAQLIDTLRPHLPTCGTLADIGCGYGQLAHQLVQAHPHLQIHACTHSKKQASAIPNHPRLHPHHRDWLQHPLPPASLDAALALESLSHFPDFDTALQKTAAALRPGGTLIIADWFGTDSPLLRHLAAAAHLPPWRPLPHFLEIAARHDLHPVHHYDLTAKVAPTWTALFWQSLLLPIKKPRLLPTLIHQTLRRPSLLWAAPLIRLSYQNRTLTYHLLTLKKQPTPNSNQ